MKVFLVAALLLLVATESRAACEATPRPIENEGNTRAGTLLLKADGRYYVLDSCVTISRWQFKPALKLGFLNKFGDWDGPAFFSVKANRTFTGASPRQFSLTRSPGWHLGQPLKKIKEVPYNGSVADWNDAHTRERNPEDFGVGQGFPVPWHAYLDAEKSSSSTADLGFWKVDPAEITSITMMTNYLIRFTPSDSGVLLDFDVYIPDEVLKIDLTIGSAIDPMRQKRTFVLVP